MSKILIIHNVKPPRGFKQRISKLLVELEENLVLVKMQPGFSSKIPNDVTEIIFAGGSDIKISKNPTLKKEVFDFVNQCELPLIGICNGAQLIARAFGANIVQLPSRRTGVYTVRIIKDKRVFNNKYVQSVYKSQLWSLQNLPSEFDIYACSQDGVEIYKHKNRQVAGVQFHPELFTNACQGAELFRLFRNKVLADKPVQYSKV